MADSFIFYSSFLEALQDLPDDSFNRLVKCILNLGINGEETELQGFEKNIFATIRAQILASRKRRENGKFGELGAEYGKLGGRPKKEGKEGDNDKPPMGDEGDNDKTPNGVIEKPPNDNGNVNHNVNHNCNGNTTAIDQKLYSRIITAGIDPLWLEGQFTFPDYATEYVEKEYPDKPQPERRRLVISAITTPWENLVADFITWRNKRQRETAVAEDKQRIGSAKQNRPTTCGHCGAALGNEKVACPNCDYRFWFEEEKGEWIFTEPIDFNELKKPIGRASKTEE